MIERMQRLAVAGQSFWLDYIRRGLIASGELEALVEAGITGVTSNPTILHKAITQSDDYTAALHKLSEAGKSDSEIYETLATDDIRQAADVLKPVYERTNGLDGYVSLEVDPALSSDTQGTIDEAKRLFARIDRPNVMIKIPGTEAGLPAIRAVIASGINVNVTLIFSCSVYEGVMDAYLSGLEDRRASGGDLSRVASVASFFVSRVDGKVDKLLQERIDAGAAELKPLLGKSAIANAKVAYRYYQEVTRSDRFKSLSAAGAQTQRPLWASTSTKDPAYPDTLYVDNLIGPDTVNTLPPATYNAFLDHGVVARTIDDQLELAQQHFTELAKAGIDIDQITAALRSEGVDSFAKSFDTLMSDLRASMAAT